MTDMLLSIPCEHLAEIAARLAGAEQLWRAVVRHDPIERRPVRLIGAAHYEAWVIGWLPGQELELHDHGGSAGALAVVEGRLTELTPASAGLAAHTLDTGRVRRLPRGIVHGVRNDDVDPATSIHVYSPPLTSMTVAGERRDVAPAPPVLPSALASVLLHPASA